MISADNLNINGTVSMFFGPGHSQLKRARVNQFLRA